MPIPQEFNCNEVWLNQSEIETFKTAMLNLSGIVEANEPYDVSKEVKKRIPPREAQNFSKAERDAVYAQEKAKAAARDEKFLTDNKAACKNGLLALKNLPDGRDPKSMFRWVKQFPELLWRDNLKLAFDRYGEELSLTEDDRQTISKNFELAKAWFKPFGHSQYFNELYGFPGTEEYYSHLAENFLEGFKAKADEMNILARDEELIAGEQGAFDAPEEPAVEEEIQNEVEEESQAQLIEEEIPRVAPKEEAPAQKEKIKPINISERIHVTEGTVAEFGAKAKVYLDQSAIIYEEIKSNVTPNNFEHLNEMGEKASVRLFKQNYGDVIQKEMAAMLAGPKEHSSNGALEWLESFPHLSALIGRSTGFAKACLSDREDFSQEHMDLAYQWQLFLKDGLPNKYESDYVKHSGAKADETFVKDEKRLYDKAWKAVHKAEKTKIDSIVEKLENAKTFYNSGEYNRIIDIAKMLYHTDELPKKFKDSATTPEERHAFKLASIKAQIDAYIDHKAKDGVKPNVYHKLAAVEELNRYVCEELNRIGVKHIPDNELKTFEGDYAPTCLAEEKGDMAVKNRLPNENMVGAEKEECARVLDCMGRILVHAGKLDVGFEKTYALNEMANAFQGGPNVDLDAPQEEPEVKLPDDDLVENGADLLG